MNVRIVAAISGIVWLIAVCAGLGVLWSYETAPGRAGMALPRLPAETQQMARGPQRATLMMFAHPRCPCTRASLGELNRLMALCQKRITVHVLFFKPQGFKDDWAKTDLWRSAAAIPGVNVRCDEDGSAARRYHVETSGHTVLYDAVGRRLFSGGITSARGHAGDNPGRHAIVSLLTTGTAGHTETPIFGCPLFDPES